MMWVKSPLFVALICILLFLFHTFPIYDLVSFQPEKNTKGPGYNTSMFSPKPIGLKYPYGFYMVLSIFGYLWIVENPQ